MSEKRGLLSSGLAMVSRNKRYIFWFWLLNLTLAEFGTSGFRKAAHAIMDHSLYANRMMNTFDLGVFTDLLFRPNFGQMDAMTTPALYFGFLFFLATAVFLPGVFSGYASTYRLPREDFFRSCGRNLWRFIRLMIIAGIVMGIVAGILFAINGVIVKKAGESTNELLPFELQMTGLAIIFLVMSTLRIWFDLAEVETVLNDQRAVRKAVGTAFKQTFRSLGNLLGAYVLTTIAAAIFLVGGIWLWMKIVAPSNIWGAFLVAQFTLYLLLIPRFWQRGVAVSYWKQHMMVPVIAATPMAPPPIAVPAFPAPAPTTSSTAVETIPQKPPTETPGT
ncbi:MAG TPA: hypothetical protein VMD76_13590 [Candidatus Sulfotelmatobacter sp.]|nr:hypothetical protein [Candidatus Sulfotelmatobacter sp.]